MRRLLTWIATAAVVLVGGNALMDATQNRPDPEVLASTTVRIDVATRDFAGGERTAITTLLAVCMSTLGGSTYDGPRPVEGEWQVVVSPAIGHNGRKRFEGCIEDLTLDRVSARVTAMATA